MIYMTYILNCDYSDCVVISNMICLKSCDIDDDEGVVMMSIDLTFYL